MVFLTVIIHVVLYALFTVGFLANLVMNRAWPYWILLFLCIIQVIIDVVIIATPDTSSAIMTLGFIGVLVLALTLQTLVARLFHVWSSSLKRSIPRHKHRFLVWSVNTMHLLHAAVGVLGIIALILLSRPATLLSGITVWSICLWCFAFLSFYLAGIQILFGFLSYMRIPSQVMEPRRKLRQLIRLFIMTILLGLYFLLNAWGMFTSSLMQFVGGWSLYLVLAIAVWPWALYGYEFSPGTREVHMDPDGEMVVTARDAEVTPMMQVDQVDASPVPVIVQDSSRLHSKETVQRVSGSTETASLSLVPSSEIRNSEELVHV